MSPSFFKKIKSFLSSRKSPRRTQPTAAPQCVHICVPIVPSPQLFIERPIARELDTDLLPCSRSSQNSVHGSIDRRRHPRVEPKNEDRFRVSPQNSSRYESSSNGEPFHLHGLLERKTIPLPELRSIRSKDDVPKSSSPTQHGPHSFTSIYTFLRRRLSSWDRAASANLEPENVPLPEDVASDWSRAIDWSRASNWSRESDWTRESFSRLSPRRERAVSAPPTCTSDRPHRSLDIWAYSRERPMSAPPGCKEFHNPHDLPTQVGPPYVFSVRSAVSAPHDYFHVRQPSVTLGDYLFSERRATSAPPGRKESYHSRISTVYDESLASEERPASAPHDYFHVHRPLVTLGDFLCERRTASAPPGCKESNQPYSPPVQVERPSNEKRPSTLR